MRKQVLATALALTGCFDSSGYTTCADPVFGQVFVEDPSTSCLNVNVSTKLVRDLMIDSGMWTSFDADAKGIELKVWSDVGSAKDPNNLGMTHTLFPTNYTWVEEGVDMISTVHEMFHVQDAFQLYYPNVEHCHDKWDVNGRFALSQLYVFTLTGHVRCNIESPTTTKMPKLIEESLRTHDWGQVIDGWRVDMKTCQ
jgi:hypothetical protein